MVTDLKINLLFQLGRGSIMHINKEKCIGCGRCLAYCPVKALFIKAAKAVCNSDSCTECENCVRSKACLLGAIEPSGLVWPREFRALMSNPKKSFKGVQGRGTEEMKTNDVTGRYKPGDVGISMEFGRPNVGSRVRDIQYMARKLAKLNVKFEKMNPINSMINTETGNMPEELLDEFIISGILEILIPIQRVDEVLEVIFEASKHIDTVFCLDMVCKVSENDTIPVLPILERMGVFYRPNCKINVGLGRPLYKFD
jgi:ferredoxin